MATSPPANALRLHRHRRPRHPRGRGRQGGAGAGGGGGRVREVLQRRAFTRIGKGLKGGAIPREKIDEVAGVVAEQRRLVEQLGAAALRAVATAAIRAAANQDEFATAMREGGGVEVQILDGEEEARLAFLG